MSRAKFLLGMVAAALAMAVLPCTVDARILDDAVAVSLPSGVLAGAWKDLLTLVDARKGDSKAAIIELKTYFTKFGYLGNTTNTSMEFDEQLENAVRLYQQNFKLKVTGTLNAATLAQLVKPRCGREDVVDGVTQMLQSESNRSMLGVEHYAFFPGRPKWRSTRNLRYYFDEGSLSKTGSGHTVDQVKTAFRNGFAKWAAAVPLQFFETTTASNADISIAFADFEHGDENAFDGPLGILAHAFSPEDGRFHLDSSEDWAIDLKNDRTLSAIHLESVVTHEIGHLIGLGHSGDPQAIMFPSIGAREVRTALAQDDVQGAQLLYGANPTYQSGKPTESSLETSDARRAIAASTAISIAAVAIVAFV